PRARRGDPGGDRSQRAALRRRAARSPVGRPAPGDLAMGEGGSRYLHGTEPLEQRRLSRLNELINRASLRELALRGGERILEVGSGLGQFARAMARAAGPAGHVLGVERSRRQIAGAARTARAAGEAGLAEWRRGDALDLPLRRGEWGRVDVAHARFLLEH